MELGTKGLLYSKIGLILQAWAGWFYCIVPLLSQNHVKCNLWTLAIESSFSQFPNKLFESMDAIAKQSKSLTIDLHNGETMIQKMIGKKIWFCRKYFYDNYFSYHLKQNILINWKLVESFCSISSITHSVTS